MDKEKDLSKRLYKFSLKIVLLVRKLPKELAAYEIGRQLLKAGTSISANHEETRGGFSKEDFAYKLNTAFKKAKELRLLKDSKIVKEEQIKELINESKEICNILGASVKTAKKKKKKQSFNFIFNGGVI